MQNERIYCISAVVTQHIKSSVLLELVTFGYITNCNNTADFIYCVPMALIQ